MVERGIYMLKAPLAPRHTRKASTDILMKLFFNDFFGVVWSVSVSVFAAVVAAPSKTVFTPYFSSTETVTTHFPKEAVVSQEPSD